tara:strand:- start:240 stop:518 length:279 start_codon:yes stop_codon:yes gene_type:complete
MEFIVGSWYRNSRTLVAKCHSIKEQGNSFYLKEQICNDIYGLHENWWVYHSSMVEISIDEIRQYLPYEHPDLIVVDENYDSLLLVLDKLNIK